MCKPGAFGDPEVESVIDDVCRKTVERGVLLGTYAEGDFAKWRARGVGYMSVKNDTDALLEGLRSAKMKAES